MVDYGLMRGYKYHNDSLNKTYNIIFTSHMFDRRKNQTYSRGGMFESVGQVEDFIGYCLENHNLNSFIGKGKVVVKIMFRGEIQGVLLALENNEVIDDDIECNITFVTIDKQDDRHYNKFAMFHKELNLITMLEYGITKVCYTENKFISLTTIKHHGNKFKIGHYEAIYQRIGKLIEKAPVLDGMFDSILDYLSINDLVKDTYNKGSFWIKLKLFENLDLYLRLSITKINTTIYAVVILNVATLDQYNTAVKSNMSKDYKEDSLYTLSSDKVFGTDKQN